MAAKKPQTMTFADAMSHAQDYAQRMEQDGISLEEMLQCYEQGMKAIALCREQLNRAEQKIIEIQESHTDAPHQT